MSALPREQWARYGITSEAEEAECRAFAREVGRRLGLTPESARQILQLGEFERQSARLFPLSLVALRNIAEEAA